MWQNIPVQGGVIHPTVHDLFDGSSHVVPLPAYNVKVLKRCFVGTVVLMFMNWR